MFTETALNIHSEGLSTFGVSPDQKNISTTKDDPVGSENYFGHAVSKKTEQLNTAGIRPLVTISNEYQKANPVSSEAIQSINGNVLDFDEFSAQCEMHIGQNNTFISLPRTIFPEIKIGLPFSLTLDDSTGYRRPVISLRQPDPETLKDGLDEIEDMIQNL